MGPKRPQKAEAAKGHGFLGLHSVPCWFCLFHLPSFVLHPLPCALLSSGMGERECAVWPWLNYSPSLGLLSNAKSSMAFLEDLLSPGSCKSHGDCVEEESLPDFVLILTLSSSVCGAFRLQVASKLPLLMLLAWPRHWNAIYGSPG